MNSFFKNTMLLVFLFGFGINGQVNAAVTDGLVAYWSFDDCTAKDNSGNGHDGIVNGILQCVDGSIGKAFKFNGISDYINAGNSTQFNVNQHSIAVWVNKNSLSKNALIVGKVNPYVHETINFLVDTSGYFGTSFATDSEIYHDFRNTKKISDNQWRFLVMTYDSNFIRFYIDGILDSSYSRNGAVRTNFNDLVIGRHGAGNNGADAFFNGLIDEVRIYNRALTDEEIAELSSRTPEEAALKIKEVRSRQFADSLYEKASKLADTLKCKDALKLDRQAQSLDGQQHSENDQSNGYRISFSSCQAAVVEAKCMATPKCRAKKEREERQQQAERQRERQYEKEHQCDHVYAGRSFDAPGGVFGFVQRYEVIGVSPSSGKVTIGKSDGYRQETTCSAIPK